MRTAATAGPLRRLAPVLFLVALLSITGFAPVRGAPASAPSGPGSSGGGGGIGSFPGVNFFLHDGQVLTTTVGGTTDSLSDFEIVNSAPPSSITRNYTVEIAATSPIPHAKVAVFTQPLVSWTNPAQSPDGADNLPPLSDWTWTITNATGVNDTSNWTANLTSGTLDRVTVWANQTFTILGRCNLTVNVTVLPGQTDGSTSTGAGFELNAAGYSGNIPQVSGYPQMAQALRPAIVRLPLAGFIGWNRSSDQPILSFSQFDTMYDFANATGAEVLISLPAGNWGDGNNAPAGTPVYSKIAVGLHGLVGNLITRSAEYALVRQLLNHTQAAGEQVAYWDVGNEVPLNATLQAQYFAKVVQGAVDAVAAAGVPGEVGTDAGLTTAYLPVIASHTTGVGFLSFHYYPATGMCLTVSTQYCPPNGGANGTMTPNVFAATAYGHSSRVYGPSQAQQEWYNVTGNWVPTINSETNFNSFGGGVLSSRDGSDPRLNDLVGAAWLGSLLVDSSEQNVSSLVYYSLTSSANLSTTVSWPNGGFGFGLSNVTSSGKIVEFAPYFVLKLWEQYIGGGANGLSVSTSDPASVQAYAVDDGGQIHVFVDDKVGIPIHVRITVSGHYTTGPMLALDSSSYAEQYSPSLGLTQLLRAGLLSIPPSLTGTIAMPGYGVAVGVYYPLGL